VNWYKAAAKQIVPVVTPERFGTMTSKEKGRLAENRRLTTELQLLFFTEPYERKSDVLTHLAENRSITPEIQLLFFTGDYESKSWVLWYLAQNKSLWLNLTKEQRLQIKNLARGRTRLRLLRNRLEQLIGVP